MTMRLADFWNHPEVLIMPWVPILAVVALLVYMLVDSGRRTGVNRALIIIWVVFVVACGFLGFASVQCHKALVRSNESLARLDVALEELHEANERLDRQIEGKER